MDERWMDGGRTWVWGPFQSFLAHSAGASIFAPVHKATLSKFLGAFFTHVAGNTLLLPRHNLIELFTSMLRKLLIIEKQGTGSLPIERKV